MIELNTLASEIEKGLNTNDKDITYKIFSDGGQYKKALKTLRDKTQYVNGVLTLSSSTVIPTQTLIVATQEARLEIVVPLPSKDTDEQIINRHRNILDEYFQKIKVQPLTDENGNTFTVAANYSLAGSGSIQSRDGVGTSITFAIMCSYSFIENGLNSFNCVFTLDGVQVPYTSANITRVPVMEPNVYADNTKGSAKNVPTSSSLSFKFSQVPGTSPNSNALSLSIFNYLLNGSLNAKHILKVSIPGFGEKNYAVLFAQTSLSLDGVQNAGHSIDFVEAASIEETTN